MASKVRDCPVCGAHIEITKEGDVYKVNVSINKERSADSRIRTLVFPATCRECKKWISENTR